MKVSAKIFTIAVVAAFIVPVFSVLAYNIYIDPFQIIHKDFQKPTVFLKSGRAERYQRAGIINQYNIESVVIGHSHSMNYLPSKLEKELGWNKVFNVAINGRTVFEQFIIAKRCLSKHNIENILWGIEINNFIYPWNIINKKSPLNQFLYDNNRLNDLQLFLTLDLKQYYTRKQELKKRIRFEKNTLEPKKEQSGTSVAWYRGGNICRFNRPVFIADKIIRKKRFLNIDTTKEMSIQKDLLASPIELNEFVINYKDNFSHNLLPIIVKNPQTEFLFVLTAYPTLRMKYLKISNKTRYRTYFQILRNFVLDTQHYDNVKVFGFDTEKFTDDLRLYMDHGHYHLAVSNYIVEQMAQGKGLLTVENIDTYIKNFDKKVTNYRLPEKWNPKLNNKPKAGYLSLRAARLLIDFGDNYSDEKISNIALQDTPLPDCATKIIKYSNHE